MSTQNRFTVTVLSFRMIATLLNPMLKKRKFLQCRFSYSKNMKVIFLCTALKMFISQHIKEREKGQHLVSRLEDLKYGTIALLGGAGGVLRYLPAVGFFSLAACKPIPLVKQTSFVLCRCVSQCKARQCSRE